jgi:hypothetical protein
MDECRGYDRAEVLADGEVIVVVHSFGAVLATGLACVGRLSICMAAVAAVSDSWHRGRWRAGTGERHHLHAGTNGSSDLTGSF